MTDAVPSEQPLEDLLRAALSDELGPVEVSGVRRLTGGASRETWSFDATGDDGIVHRLILRRDPPGRPGPRGSMGREARCIIAAASLGIAVPRVCVHSDDVSVLGAAGVVMERIEGETIARKLLRDERYSAARERLVAECGAALAGIHSIDPAVLGEGSAGSFGAADAAPVGTDPLEEMRAALASLGRSTPTFEYALRWLEQHRPAPTADPSLVHGHFRLGNLMVDDTGLVAVLDWELVHAGDPAEDLGWLCVRAWRFGGDGPVAGLGEREELLGAYRAAGGVDIALDVLRWWEVYGTLRWGVICMVQTAVFLGGQLPSVELAAIGRRVCETEWDLLLLIAPEATRAALARSEARPVVGTAEALAAAEGDLHGRPTAADLLGAVSSYLRDEVVASGTGGMSFHARIAANVVDQVARELASGDEQRARRADALGAWGVTSESELADSVRSGAISSGEGSDSDLVGLLAEGVLDRLLVANPRYL